MIIKIEDFTYNGVYFEGYEFEFPKVMKLDEIPVGKLEEYIRDTMEFVTYEEES